MSNLSKILIDDSKINRQLNAAIVHLYAELTKLFACLYDTLHSYQPLSLDNQPILREIVKFVPRLITTACKLLSSSNIVKICSVIQEDRQSFANKLSAERSKFIQTAMAYVFLYYQSSFASAEFKFKLIIDNGDQYEFIVRLDDQIKLEHELEEFVASKICTNDQRQAMRKMLDNAYERKRSSIKNDLARQRMFEFIGHPKEKMIADHLQELADLMPHLSTQQLHLCLRHFGYDFEQVLANLCEIDKLPLDLKILLRTKDSFEDVPFYEKKMLPFLDDGEDILYNPKTVVSSDSTDNTSNNTLDLSALIEAVKCLENCKEEVVEVDGKVMCVQQFREKEKDPSEEEAKKLKEASLKFARRLGQEEEQISDEEERETEEDRKLAAEVGQSGRFNRPALFAVMDPYQDEYDDTFDHAQSYSQVDAGATTFDEKETLEMKQKRRQNVDRSPVNEVKSSRKMEPKRQTQQRNAAVINTEKDKTKQCNASTSNKTYTGGRERQLKERNKGKERQKGADKKARKNAF